MIANTSSSFAGFVYDGPAHTGYSSRPLLVRITCAESILFDVALYK
jgi:hypothetical protein